MPNILLLEKIAMHCGGLAKQIRGEGGMRTQDKPEILGAHFATDADTASQAAGLRIIAQGHSAEVVIAEEQKNSASIPPDCTLFDPLDGTTAYLNGARDYGVTLCTLRNGRPELGVMYWPEDDVLISAVRGQGCWRGGFQYGEQLRIPPWHGMYDKILVATDVGPWTPHEVLRPIADKHTVVSYMVGIYGARAIIEGFAAFYFNFNIAKIWDGAAGTLCVLEAGGEACNSKGGPVHFNSLNLDWFYARDKAMVQYALPYFKGWNPQRKK